MPDCRPQPHGLLHLLGVCNTVKPSRRREGWQGGAAGRFLTKICQKGHQNVIFDITSDIQKDSKIFLQE
jgi:chloramphenicol 3-O-phosphotransferase